MTIRDAMAFTRDPLGARLYLLLLKLVLLVMLMREYDGYYGIPVVAVLLLGQTARLIEMAVRDPAAPSRVSLLRGAVSFAASLAADAALVLGAAAIAFRL
ncbi:hypothetical protein [Sphingomonas sp.]|uniref:hypothetical protein n=1 Tax=Sphingomonas sp. TaxID=28214 RepID=UPI003B3BC5B9